MKFCSVKNLLLEKFNCFHLAFPLKIPETQRDVFNSLKHLSCNNVIDL